jgi:hypothetical protein
VLRAIVAQTARQLRVHPARAVLPILALLCGAAPALAFAQATLDPFGQATSGDAACPRVVERQLTPEEMRAEAHVRAERGTRCGMEGTCEPGGAYRRDPEINAQVIGAIAADRRFRDTSVWVTTSRRWVTLEGCVRSTSQRRALVKFVAAQPRVERVFDELKSGRR